MNENNNVAVKKKKRAPRRRKFNFIDFLLVLLIIVIIAALVYVFLPMSIFKTLGTTGTSIQYSVEILGVDEQFLDDIKENDTVIDSVTKSTIGTVTAVENYGVQYTELQYDRENGAGVMSPIAGKYNVIVTISATADFESGDGYSVNGTRIAVGEKINARFPGFLCEAYCISVPRD